MRLSDLKPNPRNPRKITDKKLEMLKKALFEFGDLSGVVFNRRSRQLVGGHQRIKALPGDAEIHIEQVIDPPSPTGTVAKGTIVIDGEGYAYREVDWDDIREKAANIAANKGAGDWDLPELSEWLLELDQNNFPLELTMFDDEELAKLMAPVNKLEPQCDEDEVPDVKESFVKVGDVWTLGRHRLMCGDSTSIDAVEKLMNGEKADITFTSPPYNAGKNIRGNFYENDSDDRSEDDYTDFLTAFTSNCLIHCDYVFVNIQILESNKRSLIKYQYRHIDNLKDIFIWNKKQYPPHINKGTFGCKWEYVFAFGQDWKSRSFPCTWQGKFPNVIETENNSGNEFAESHKAGFPVSFPEWMIEKMDFSKSVFDPFAGTGTTLIACEKTNRKCFMMELDPHYCGVIIERWQKYTGNKADRLSENRDNNAIEEGHG